jgi:hypothetical protein
MTRESIVVQRKTFRSRLRVSKRSLAEKAECRGKHNQKHSHPAHSLYTPQRARVIEILINLDQTDTMWFAHKRLA